ncbi:MAG: ferrochelatase, partial [Methylococcales bacterium]|nr:ferrochelatase [Methylococcales bacterium]
ILLLNLGTPDSASRCDVGSYLSQFLNDPRVIDIPWLARKILVNCIIVPFRSGSSSKLYKAIWDKESGSPLLKHTVDLQKKLQQAVGDDITVEMAMRYKSPSMDSVLERMKKEGYHKIIVFPLFPQYASSSTGSALQRFMEIVSQWWVIPELKIISQYYDNEDFINCIVNRAKKYDFNQYDHIIFSYHGLPERQVDKVYNDGYLCKDHHCEDELTEENYYCYKAACYQTTKAVVEKLNIPEGKYTLSFQSRLNNKWLMPFSDKVIEELAKEGAKNLLILSPAFTADCLETVYEIGTEYQEIFHKYGGEKIQLVESLNSGDDWVETIKKIALSE